MTKGKAYAAVYKGRLSFGQYLGKSGSALVFTGSPYANDHGELVHGLAEGAAAQDIQFIELPGNTWPLESEAIRCVMKALG